MSLSNATPKSVRSTSLSTLPEKDTNLATTSDELNSTITSLSARLTELKELQLAALNMESEWNKRASKVEDLLQENEIEPFILTSRKDELEDLLSRAKNYASASVVTWEELKTDIKECEGHLEAAQEAKGKIALLLVTKNLDLFPQYGIESAETKTGYTTTREIRSVIANAQALISLREGE